MHHFEKRLLLLKALRVAVNRKERAVLKLCIAISQKECAVFGERRRRSKCCNEKSFVLRSGSLKLVTSSVLVLVTDYVNWLVLETALKTEIVLWLLVSSMVCNQRQLRTDSDIVQVCCLLISRTVHSYGYWLVDSSGFSSGSLKLVTSSVLVLVTDYVNCSRQISVIRDSSLVTDEYVSSFRWMENILPQDVLSKIWFNSMWYSYVSQKATDTTFKKFLGSLNLGNHIFTFFPIWSGSHWVLAAFYNSHGTHLPGLSRRSSSILFFDSLSIVSMESVLPTVTSSGSLKLVTSSVLVLVTDYVNWLVLETALKTGTYYPSTLDSGPSVGTQGSANQDSHIAASDSSSDFDVYPMQQHPESSSQDMHALGQQPVASMFSRLKETLSRATRSEHATNEINEGSEEVDLPFTSKIDLVLPESAHVSMPATTPIGPLKPIPSETLLPNGRSFAEVQEMERYILAAREKEIKSLCKAEQHRAILAKAPMTSALPTNPLQSPELTALKSQTIGSHIVFGSKNTPNTSILDGVFLNENWE
ncbi:hypothetical protein L7F22_055828 [Adiantum nelumboides]|nr:hypothetical protein [Adiantum nelumboides]